MSGRGRVRFTPGATYRLQLRSGFGFREARAALRGIAALGVDTIYLSPILAARRGSAHGYDVVDPTRIDPAIGGEHGFEALVRELRRHRLALVLDIVPNHMAASVENPWWCDLLARGPTSGHARTFDVDWDPPDEALRGRVLLPVLTESLEEALSRGALRLLRGRAGLALDYRGLRLPLARELPRAGQLDQVLAAQHWQLAHWKEAAGRINYRRFFDVHDLAGIRAEDPRVFAATHARVLDLVRRGAVQGLRIDHIDGLRDPASYLRRLRRDAGARTYLVVEKILGAAEELPASWPVAGTTGYEFLNRLEELFVDARGLRALERAWRRATGERRSFADVVYESKRARVEVDFRSELGRLAAQLAGLARSDPRARRLAPVDFERVLTATAAAFPVYRTYVTGAPIAARDRSVIVRALREARRREPRIPAPAWSCLRRALLLETPELPPSVRRRRLDFVLRWQQWTGPLMAKGCEDRAFYLWTPLASRCEVGGDPGRLPGGVGAFHRAMRARLRRTPDALSATSTHDTKRSEDARARIAVLSELEREWTAGCARWCRLNARAASVVGGRRVPDAREEWHLYQALIGAWPLAAGERTDFVARMRGYVIKAAREAGVHTSWREPDPEHERALCNFVESILGSRGESRAGVRGDARSGARFRRDFRPWAERVASLGALASLGRVVLKITAPGVPDFYQGAQGWLTSLVDPDNRRRVDFGALEGSFRAVRTGARRGRGPRGWQDGRLKVFVTSRALALRRANRELFARGAYLPLRTLGTARDELCVFARRLGAAWAIAAVACRVARRGPMGKGCWREARIVLPRHAPRAWTNALTGAQVEARSASGEATLELAELFAELPLALLAGGDAVVDAQVAGRVPDRARKR